MASMAPRGTDPPVSLPGSIYAGCGVDEALGGHPAGGLLPFVVLMAVARRLNPPSRAALLIAADISSAPPAVPDRDAEEMPEGRVHHHHHHQEGPAGLTEGEELQVSSRTYAAVDHHHQAGGRPAGLPDTKAFQIGYGTSAAFHHHQVGGRPAGLPEGEALQIGYRTCAAVHYHQAGGHTDGLPEVEALQVGSQTYPADPCCVDQAGGSKGFFDEKAFRCCGSLLGIDPPERDTDVCSSPSPYTTSGLSTSASASWIPCANLSDTCNVMIREYVEGKPFQSIHTYEVACDSDSEAEDCVNIAHTAALPPPKKSATLASQGGNGQRPIRPRSQGPMGGLPQELIVMIAREVVKSSVRDATAMKLSCTLWNEAFEIQGPFLVVSRLYPDTSVVTPLKIVSEQGAQGQLVMKAVNWLSPPPTHNMCWGSTKGLLALRDVRNSKVHLHCPTCGAGRTLPDLPLKHVPKGAYLRGGNFLLAILTDTTQPAGEDRGIVDDEVYVDKSLICLPCFSIVDGPTEDGGGDEDDGVGDEDINWTWGRYPGAEQIFPMRTVNFIDNTTFVGATSSNVVIIDKLNWLLSDPFLTVRLQEQLNLDACTVTWLRNGQHIFVCGTSAYLCALTRSIMDLNDVGIRCFVIEQDDEATRFFLTEVNTIGPYSVYVGSNEPLVLPADGDIPGRSPNTVYTEDNDGMVRNKRVVGINVGTQEVQEIFFSDDIVFAPGDKTPSAWTGLVNDSCHMG